MVRLGIGPIRAPLPHRRRLLHVHRRLVPARLGHRAVGFAKGRQLATVPPPTLVARARLVRQHQRLAHDARRHQWSALKHLRRTCLPAADSFSAVIPTLVTISHHYAVPFRDSANKAIAQLRNAAPSYNPATFNVGQLLVLVAPVSATANDGVEALVYLRRTWIAWLSLIAFLSAVFTPFSSYHLFTLRRVAKTRADMTSKSHVRTTQSRWPAVLVRRAERLNPYYVVLVQTLAYHVIILVRRPDPLS